MYRRIKHYSVLGVFGIGLVVNAQEDDFSTTTFVGQVGTNLYRTSVHQLVSPVGKQVELPGLRPQAVALSPDGKLLVVSGKTAELKVLDPVTGEILQSVALPSGTAAEPTADITSEHFLLPDKKAQLSFTGLVFSEDGRRLYLSSVNGTIKVFEVDKKGKVTGRNSFNLPPADAPKRKIEIPAGLVLSRDGKKLYVALNLSNRVAELDAQTGEVLRSWDVGVAPYDVSLVNRKLYVSNWGGRRPDASSVTGPAGKGTLVRVDSVRHIANEGSVSIIDLNDKTKPKEILTGLHASALKLSPNGKYMVVANAGSDTLSVFNVKSEEITETIWTRQSPADLFGASPNALAFDKSGRKLFVCNGTQNAVAVIDFNPGSSKLTGLIPVGWFPGAITYDAAREALYVANIKGHGNGIKAPPGEKQKYESTQHLGTVSLLKVPSEKELPQHTSRALKNMRYPLLAAARLPARPGQPARPVPERIGEPSVFKHVVYIIKENRTYDQVLGDIPEGNGDPALCVFGEGITPNQHKLSREFVLLDNTYCSGIISSDGHEWATTAFATDYMEKSFADFPRSYPDGMEDSDVDALAYSPAGFIWDNAIAHGKTLRDYGEFAITDKAWKNGGNKKEIKFMDHWRDLTNEASAIQISSRPAVESLRPYLCTNTVGWDMEVPDQFRANQFLKELKEFEAKGEFPNLLIICLPNDHTSGTKAETPTPAAHVADNDLAFARIIEGISHSKFWPETCILAIEDDPQAGWDHVSGYRTTAYVVSPYTKRRQVVKTQYNQVSIIRTIEQILGLPPMNQMDATATPMFDCFTDRPDLTPFTSVLNTVALDKLNPAPRKISDSTLRRDAQASAKLPLKEPDRCPEDTLNRIIWHATKGSRVPYPAWAVTATGVDDD